MSSPSSGRDSRSLLGHLETLYPLACILAGPDEADSILRRVYERAAASPRTERPENRRAWLLRLLLDEHEGSAEPSATSPDSGSESSDPYRREVAEDILRDAVPIAMAACSIEERFLLALPLLGESPETLATLAPALNTTRAEVEKLHSDAWSALRASLREVLSNSERSLVEETLSDTAVKDAVETLLVNRYPRVPTSIRTQVTHTLQESDPPERPATQEETDDSDDATSVSDHLPAGLGERSVVGGLAILAVLVIAGLGVFFLDPSTPGASAPGPSLVAFSAERIDSVQLDLKTNAPSEGEAYVESTWNRRVAVPSLKNAPLQGVGHVRVSSGVEVPVFLYVERGEQSRMVVFAYSYALLDRMETQATLAPALREELARGKHLVTHQPDDAEQGVLWRNQDDVFVAVTPAASSDSLNLGDRVRPGS